MDVARSTQSTARRRAPEYWLVAAVVVALLASVVLTFGVVRVPF